MNIKIILIDINAKMVDAWRDTFEENPEVTILQGSMLDQQVDAWVSPTNSRGSMDGGLDAVIKGDVGQYIENRVQGEIHRLYGGLMPVGHATCVPTDKAFPKFLISTPTMVSSQENISDTMNVALACAAAFQAIHIQNAKQPQSIKSVALPGLGASTGQTPVEICADLMWSGYHLFRRRAFSDFAAMRQALEEELGDLGPSSTVQSATIKAAVQKANALAASGAGFGSQAPSKTSPSTKNEEVDFDDFE